MQERLSDNKVTLHKLRKLLGFVASSEKLSNLLGEDDKKSDQRKTTRPKKPKKKKRGSDKIQTRTGLYASGIIATTEQQDIILFQTNIGHAGEFIDELLENRLTDKPPPILMSDAQRLAYHQQHSLPVMEKIRSWAEQHFSDETVEKNSTLGKAISYFNRHFERLTLFCTIEGAKIDTNYMEAILKLIVRNRKNAYFYKTPAGAAISDVITSCIATIMQADVNVFDYFKCNSAQSYGC
ncbi:MAG: transposase [Pseudomonadota bacterium]